MQGDKKVIEHLNTVLRNELTAINQYFLHARMFKNWGLTKLDAHEYAESVDEMRHADQIIERILFLEGLPNLQDLDKVYIGETVKECLECDLNAEKRAHPLYLESIEYCESVRDYASREILVRILESEEEHIDFLETQLDLISKIGEERYMQSQMKEGG